MVCKPDQATVRVTVAEVVLHGHRVKNVGVSVKVQVSLEVVWVDTLDSLVLKQGKTIDQSSDLFTRVIKPKSMQNTHVDVMFQNINDV